MKISYNMCVHYCYQKVYTGHKLLAQNMCSAYNSSNIAVEYIKVNSGYVDKYHDSVKHVLIVLAGGTSSSDFLISKRRTHIFIWIAWRGRTINHNTKTKRAQKNQNTSEHILLAAMDTFTTLLK